MPKRDDYLALTKREQDIMNILWMADQPLTASQIAKSEAVLPPRVPSRPSRFISRTRPTRKVCESSTTARLLRGSPARLPSAIAILPPWNPLRLGRFCRREPGRGRILRGRERMDREESRRNCRRSRCGARKWSRFLRSHRSLSDWRKPKHTAMADIWCLLH